MKFAIIINRAIRFTRVIWIARGRKLAWDIPDQGSGCPAFFERSHIIDRFDGGTWLTCGAVRHVDLPGDSFIVEIGRANHGKDLARGWLDRHKRAVVRILVSKLRDLIGDQSLSLVLKCGVKGGVYDEARAIDRLRVILRFQLLTDEVHPVWITRIDIRRVEDVGLHLICCIRRSHFIYADGYLAITDFDTSIRLACPKHQ